MQKNLAMRGSFAQATEDGDACLLSDALALGNELTRLRYALSEIELEGIFKLLAPIIGRAPPVPHRWPRAGNGSIEIPPLGSLKANVAALRFQFMLWQFAYRERKAAFDPNQPRAPKGPGGGRWIYAGGGGRAAGGDGDSSPPDSSQSDRAPLHIIIYAKPKPDGSGDGNGPTSEAPPLRDPPPIPTEEPETAHALFDFAKAAAWWAARALAKEAANPVVGTLLNAIDAVYWGYRAYPYVKAYLDPPKTLDELQRAASNPAEGYNIHHVVEKQAAKDAKYPDQMINGPDNLVRIPALKHWQITGWYMRPNSKYNRLSPREYLRDKDWAERTRVGREALIEFEVLKP